MANRKEEYRLKDGSLTTDRAKGAVLVDPRKIVGLALYFSLRIPPQFFVATAQHESAFTTNKVVTENGLQFEGVYQITRAGAQTVGQAQANLLDLFEATKTASLLYEKRLDVVIRTALTAGQTVIKDEDVWAYLAIANHSGPAAAIATIEKYGLDWQAYKTRNPGSKIISYGDDAITGGSSWQCYC